jgi:hypothetical protein
MRVPSPPPVAAPTPGTFLHTTTTTLTTPTQVTTTTTAIPATWSHDPPPPPPVDNEDNEDNLGADEELSTLPSGGRRFSARTPKPKNQEDGLEDMDETSESNKKARHRFTEQEKASLIEVSVKYNLYLHRNAGKAAKFYQKALEEYNKNQQVNRRLVMSKFVSKVNSLKGILAPPDEGASIRGVDLSKGDIGRKLVDLTEVRGSDGELDVDATRYNDNKVKAREQIFAAKQKRDTNKKLKINKEEIQLHAAALMLPKTEEEAADANVDGHLDALGSLTTEKARLEKTNTGGRSKNHRGGYSNDKGLDMEAVQMAITEASDVLRSSMENKTNKDDLFQMMLMQMQQTQQLLVAALFPGHSPTSAPPLHQLPQHFVSPSAAPSTPTLFQGGGPIVCATCLNGPVVAQLNGRYYCRTHAPTNGPEVD